AEYVIHDRYVHDTLRHIVQPAMLRTGKLRMRRAFIFFQIDRVADQPDGSAHSAGAVERSLRTAKDFALGQIEQKRLRLARIEKVIPDRDRSIIQVDRN